MCGTKRVKSILKRELLRYDIGEELIFGMREYEMMALLSFILSDKPSRERIIKRAEQRVAPPAYLDLLNAR